MISIRILSQREIQRYTSNKKHIVISIRDSWEPSFPLPDNQNRVDALRLQFDDIVGNEKWQSEILLVGDKAITKNSLILFDIEIAKRIKEFVLKHQDVEQVIVNCFMGISRSAAVAKTLNEWKPELYEPSLQFRHRPNTLVNTLLLEELKKAT